MLFFQLELDLESRSNFNRLMSKIDVDLDVVDLSIIEIYHLESRVDYISRLFFKFSFPLSSPISITERTGTFQIC